MSRANSQKKKTSLKMLGLMITLVVVFFNAVAFNHARSMLIFTDNGIRTEKPEELGLREKTLVLIKGINVPRPKNEATPKLYGLSYEVYQINVTSEIILEGWLISHENSRGHILMFHGYATAKSSILPEAAALHEMGYDVFMVDFRGSGGSSLSQTSIGYYESDDVAASAQFVEKNFGWDNLVFYGQSMGSVAILKSVNDGKIHPSKIIIESVYDKTLSAVNNRFDSMNIPSFPSSYVLVFWGSIIEKFNGFTHNPLDYARSVQCPIMLMHGDSDPRATLDQARNVYVEIQSEKRLIVFENAVHESLYTSNPQKWNTEVLEFLDNNSG
ncbi:MAG: alpha/beta fold hydrolase [Anaerolineales bacterium]|nr:alpha/beta fold hydrolase [Anaerolineales bacterium]